MNKFSPLNPVTLNTKREKWLDEVINQEIKNIDSILEGIVLSIHSQIDNRLQNIERLVEEIDLTDDVSPIRMSQLSGCLRVTVVDNHYLKKDVPYYLNPPWTSFLRSKTELFPPITCINAVDRLTSKTISSKIESTIYEKLSYFQSEFIEKNLNAIPVIDPAYFLLENSQIELIACSVHQNVEEKFSERFLQNLFNGIDIKIQERLKFFIKQFNQIISPISSCSILKMIKSISFSSDDDEKHYPKEIAYVC
jgi:hypothetical protein